MNGCIYRTTDNQCEKFSDPVRNTLSWCVGDEPCEARMISNADKIRAMSDEELAENVIVVKAPTDYCHGPCNKDMNCYKCRLEWLKKEVDDEHTDT